MTGPTRADGSGSTAGAMSGGSTNRASTRPITDTIADAEQVERLRGALAARRAERVQAERVARPLETVHRAIAVVRRDRDAGTSVTLRRDRALFEQLLGDVDDLVTLLARISVRLGTLDLPPDAPPVRSGFTVGQAGLAALVDLAAALNPPTSSPAAIAATTRPTTTNKPTSDGQRASEGGVG